MLTDWQGRVFANRFEWGGRHSGLGAAGLIAQKSSGAALFTLQGQGIFSGAQGLTGGVAMPQTELETLLTWLDPARKPLPVQLQEPTYQRLVNRWVLPKLINASQR